MKIIYKDGTVGECPQEEELHVLRHTAAHIMAQAIKRLFPQADFAYGPATQNGFFYDVDLGDTKLTQEDLENIEKEMKKIVKANLPIKSFVLNREDSKKLMEERGEKFKLEHMEDLSEETEFSFYQQGEYVDMCLGPHLTYTKALKAFKVTQQSGAYWKNDSSRQMLTRINGVAFRTNEELAEWEKQQQEARERDHRKIGREMQLFMTDDLVGRGLPMFLPNGAIIWEELQNYIVQKERRLGYQHVMTPCVGSVELYKTSGHWEHYKDNMFPAMELENEAYVLRPMNCPHHMRIYASRPRSYRNLPLRIGEIAHDFRFESSGTLKGIERARHFCQNDAHLFCTPDQIKDEVSKVCDLIFDAYKDFGITDYRCVLSLRDPADKKKYHDDDAMWNTAEEALRQVLTELGIHFTEEIGEAAFYGPKLDVNVKPAVGAEYWARSTPSPPVSWTSACPPSSTCAISTPTARRSAPWSSTGPSWVLWTALWPTSSRRPRAASRRGWRRCRSRFCPSAKRPWTTPGRSTTAWRTPAFAYSWTNPTRRSVTRSVWPSRRTGCPICSSSAPRRPRPATSPCVPAPARTWAP